MRFGMLVAIIVTMSLRVGGAPIQVGDLQERAGGPGLTHGAEWRK